MEKKELRNFAFAAMEKYATRTDKNYNPIHAYRHGFIEGAEFILSNIWHSPEEPAKRNEKIIIHDIRDTLSIGHFFTDKWKTMVDLYEMKRWAYARDFLPI